MQRHEALAEVELRAKEYSATKLAYENARESLDKALLAAKTSGATFRELSFFSRRSVGFAQKALTRQGYIAAPRGDEKVPEDAS